MTRNAKPRLTLLVGLPGSGKSTWAARQPGIVLSSDSLRALLSGDETNQAIHGAVFRTLRFLLRERLRLGQSHTILDATNLLRKHRRPFLKIAAQYGAETEAVFFDVPLALALARNAARNRVVPPEVIREMAAQLQPPQQSEGFVQIKTIGE